MGLSQVLTVCISTAMVISMSASAQQPSAPTQPPPPEAVRQPFDDARALTIVHFANTAEVEQAKLALQRSKDARVRKLAQTMVVDHGEADKEGMALMVANKLSITTSPTAKQLSDDADRALTDLRGKHGAEFDRAYLDVQLQEHTTVLKLIDDELLPGVRAKEVKLFLGTIRPKIAAHLEHVRQLQAGYASAAR